MMRRTVLLVVGVIALTLTVVSPASASVPYPDVTFPADPTSIVQPGFWDLTQGPVTISYTLDLSGAPNVAATSPTNWSLMGIVGLFGGGAGAQMVGFNSDSGQPLFPTYPDNDASLDLDDKFNMQRFPDPGSYSETMYDTNCTTKVVGSAIGSGNNYGIWFDRDGVDQWQDDMWGMVNGGTYNTGGIYNVVLTFDRTANDPDGKGFVCASFFPTLANDDSPTGFGIPTGFYSGGWVPTGPQLFPYGLSFGANPEQMKGMQVRVSGASDGGAIVVKDLTVEGHLLYGFEGFFPPIDNAEPNSAKAGQTIPVKWRLTDYLGTAISDPATFESITWVSSPGACAYAMADAIETYASMPGTEPQYLGDGNWLFNWKTPKGLVGCYTMTLTLNDGSEHTAEFIFK